ncbi:MAG: pyruvate ferredoxin oxidoreductase [Negativicutes bacterium]|nr:pyruvate ferredoxin oxidoreductase [Negativicutes bacterium]
MGKISVMEGSLAVAHAIRACRPGVISAYPISPQTHIVEELAKFVADGELDAQYLRVDSEFSAASVVYGSSATGVRSYTASSSQGLLLMTEVMYAMAGTRLPVVMTGVNRTVSAPVTIQVDHQDTMALRDSGVIQLYVESAQEAYATHIQAFRLAEDHDVLLPVMVCMDGWVLTHSYNPVKLADQELVDRFLPPFKPVYRLDPKNPLTYGAIANDEVSEFRLMQHQAMDRAKGKINQIAKEYETLFGDYFGGVIETYRTDDAETILVALGSVIGTIKDTVDDLRAAGEKVGVVKLRAYRPFPGEELLAAVKDAKRVIVIDKSLSVGQSGPVGTDTKNYFYNRQAPPVFNILAGMGGREVNKEVIAAIVRKVVAAKGDIPMLDLFDAKQEYLR